MSEDTKISKSKSISFEFFPSDWMTDTALRMCSVETRGLWIDLLCLMYLSEKKGFLLIGKEKLTDENLRKILRISKKKFQFLMTELLKYNLIKIDDLGVYFCKRIVDSEHISSIRRSAALSKKNQETQVIQRVLHKQNGQQNFENGENLLEQNELFNLNKDNFKNNHKDIITLDTISDSSNYNHTVLTTNNNNNIYINNKEKEKKIEKKEKETKSQILLVHPLQIFVSENCPQVSKLRTQLSEVECEKLLSKFPKESIHEVLMRMENFKQLPTKYVSVYLTLNNWLNRKSNEATTNNNEHRRQDFENAIRNF